MFTLFKLVKHFFLPPTLIALGMAASLILMHRRRYALGKALLSLTLVTYYLLSIEPVAIYLSYLHEKKAAMMADNLIDAGPEKAAAIVILGGGMRKKEGYRLEPELEGRAWSRLWHGIELYRELEGQVPIIYCGGSGDPFDPDMPEAEVAKSYAVSMGIPKGDFWGETISRDTYENGLQTKRILDERFPGVDRHRIIVVTSAIHMRRAIGVMKRLGFEALPAPTDFESKEFKLDPLSFVPEVDNFSISFFCIHEWLGIAGYRLRGRM